MAKATFAAGCFWGVEATFRQIPWRDRHPRRLHRRQVGESHVQRRLQDRTGHAEAVEVEYDPAKVSYEKLLSISGKTTIPTQLNRQGPDFGKPVSLCNLLYSPEQEQAAQSFEGESRESGRFSRPIVTQIVPAVTFYEAEDYHQQYLEKRGLATCHI